MFISRFLFASRLSSFISACPFCLFFCFSRISSLLAPFSRLPSFLSFLVCYAFLPTNCVLASLPLTPYLNDRAPANYTLLYLTLNVSKDLSKDVMLFFFNLSATTGFTSCLRRPWRCVMMMLSLRLLYHHCGLFVFITGGNTHLIIQVYWLGGSGTEINLDIIWSFKLIANLLGD